MGLMVHRLVVIAAVLSLAATARAQAPGEMPVSQAPGASEPIAAPHASVMANRWAVGLALGGLGVTPKDQPDNQANFSVGELSLRFRATLHLELAVAIGGGHESPRNDGTTSNRDVGLGALELRYRFAPEQRWNWWLMGGLGALAITDQGATDQQRKDAQRPLGELGIGIERRFERFALHAELRAIGVGPDRSAQLQPVTGGAMAAPSQTTMPVPTGPAPMSSQGSSGGELTIGASYYF
jgi:hypothetical protein